MIYSSKDNFVSNLIIIILFLIISAGSLYINYGNKEVNKVTIIDKEVKRYDEEDKYIVFTKDEYGNSRVYENVDMLFICKFNSSDIQAELETGKTYEIESRGFRIKFFSSYPNITDVKEVE